MSTDPAAPLFEDRADAGRALARALGPRTDRPIVYGLARGGVPVAAEVAAACDAPLDVLVVRKIGHPLQPEYALGALARGHVVLREPELAEQESMRRRIEAITERARLLDEELHAEIPPIDPAGAPCLLVDDGLATGATMTAACRWARANGAERVVVGLPVAARESLERLADEADEICCPHAVEDFWAVSVWYRDFGEVGEHDVIDAVRAARALRPAPEQASR